MAEAGLNKTDVNIGRFKCFSCTRIYDKQSDNFFISGSDIYIENDYYIPWCKKCINEIRNKSCKHKWERPEHTYDNPAKCNGYITLF